MKGRGGGGGAADDDSGEVEGGGEEEEEGGELQGERGTLDSTTYILQVIH